MSSPSVFRIKFEKVFTLIALFKIKSIYIIITFNGFNLENWKCI